VGVVWLLANSGRQFTGAEFSDKISLALEHNGHYWTFVWWRHCVT
jgi:hypothetical protein